VFVPPALPTAAQLPRLVPSSVTIEVEPEKEGTVERAWTIEDYSPELDVLEREEAS
jgi:hypothetical protein